LHDRRRRSVRRDHATAATSKSEPQASRCYPAKPRSLDRFLACHRNSSMFHKAQKRAPMRHSFVANSDFQTYLFKYLQSDWMLLDCSIRLERCKRFVSLCANNPPEMLFRRNSPSGAPRTTISAQCLFPQAPRMTIPCGSHPTMKAYFKSAQTHGITL
jgi:hypothetical protein